MAEIVCIESSDDLNEFQELKIPHVFYDQKGLIRSCHRLGEIEGNDRFEVLNFKKEKIGSLRCKEEDFPILRPHFQQNTPDLNLLKINTQKTIQSIIQKDIDSLLYEAAHFAIPLQSILQKAATLLHTHLEVDCCKIFILEDGSFSEAVSAVDPEKPEWQGELDFSLMNLAAIAMEQRKPYLCNHPKKDENFSGIGESVDIIQNLIFFPIFHGDEGIGLVQVFNKHSHSFKEDDLTILNKFGFALSHLIREEFEKKKREEMKQTSTQLENYLSKNVVKEISRKGTHGGLGGEHKKVVVLFADIRSFTSISEQLDPAVLVQLLNQYFEEMSEIIVKYNGTVDKLVGDLIMAVWNIPTEQADPEVLAMKAAFEMQKRIQKTISKFWYNEGIRQFGIGIGVNSGTGVVGNLGSSHFMNYTVIGDVVNLAQRLEAKARPGEIWVPEEFHTHVEGKIPKPIRKEYKLTIKGKSKKISAFVFSASNV